MAPARAALRFVGGAVIGFDVAPDVLGALRRNVDYAIEATSDQIPTVTYRRRFGTDAPTVFERHDARRDIAVECVGDRLDDVIDDLHLSVALHATTDVFVHAGVVAWNGSAILLPGRSHVGKSTLVEALVRAGAIYLSDEYARITEDGSIAPYPRPIHLRTPSGRRVIDPHSIGEVADQAWPPGLIVFTRHVADAAFRPLAVQPAQAALDLFDNTVIAELHPTRATAAVARVARRASAVRSDRPDVANAARTILALADNVKATP